MIKGFVNFFKLVFNILKIELFHFRYLFESDNDCFSRIVRKIRSNPSDWKKYIDSIEKLRNGSFEETIELETVGVITITTSFRNSKIIKRDNLIEEILQ